MRKLPSLKRLLAVPAATVVLVLGTVGLASATSHSVTKDPTYTVCVNDKGYVFSATLTKSHVKGSVKTTLVASCPKGTDAVKVNSQGPVGPAGPAGAAGAQGPAGPAGAASVGSGAAGAQGPAGPAGATGAQGAKGDTGATGAAGANGTNGTNGAPGATGAPGTNALFTYGPYTVNNDPDSGNSGKAWATDNFSVTIQVTPQEATSTSSTIGNSYNVTVLVEGTSTTIADAPDPSNSSTTSGPTEAGGVTVPLYGVETFNFPVGTDFDPVAAFSYTPPANTSTTDGLYDLLNQWFGAYFANYTGGVAPSISDNIPDQGVLSINGSSAGFGYGYGFYYNVSAVNGVSTVAGAGTLAETDHGNAGNITG